MPFIKPLGQALTVGMLEKIPTLSQGQFSDLKIDTGLFRVWLSRMTEADYGGQPMPEDHPIEYETVIAGRWVACDKNAYEM